MRYLHKHQGKSFSWDIVERSGFSVKLDEVFLEMVTTSTSVHIKFRLYYISSVTFQLFWLLRKGQTVSTYVYCPQMKMARDATRCYSQGSTSQTRPILAHDNATPHVSKVAPTELTKTGFGVLPHPPYSPNMAPTICRLFRSRQNRLAERQFQDKEELKKNSSLTFFD